MAYVELTLWPACVRTHALPDQIAAAAQAGFSSLAINPATYHAAVSSGLSPQDILRIADYNGVRFSWVDAVSGWLPIRYPADSPELKGFLDYDLKLAFEIADILGAEAILAIGCFAEGALPLSQQIDCFGELCREAKVRNLRVGLEFIPTWGIGNLKSAWRIASAVDAQNGGYVVDTWHFFRSNSDPNLLQQIPDDRIFAVQVADAASDCKVRSLLDDSLNFRKLPGDGALPLARLLDTITTKGTKDFGPEVFSIELDQVSAREAAILCANSMRAILRRDDLPNHASAMGTDDVSDQTRRQT
jgi:sugar phosphate isomerase/epimerase